jgi:photosystem II stability/assembly factor-like uncharacterized protein
MAPRARIIAICIVLATVLPRVTLAQGTQSPIPEWVGIGPDSGSLSALAIDPQNPKIVYAATRGGLFKSTDGAASWKLSNSGLPTPTVGFAASAYAVVSLAIDPQTPSTIYAGVRGASLPLCSGMCNILVSGGIFKSTDSGATWSAVNAGLEGEWFLGSLTIDPWNPRTLYAATYHSISDATCARAPCPPQRYASGVFKTMDSGENWYPASAGLPSADALSVSLAIDPQDPDTLYDGTTNGVFKSMNGGVTWVSVMSGVLSRVLVVDSIDHNTVYVGTTKGILATRNGGGSWSSFSSFPAGIAVTSLAIDPQLSSTLYATVTYGASQGIFKSVDGGVSWLKASDEADAVTLVIDPSDSNTIYAATSGHGLLKTADAGSSWTPASFGLKQTYVQKLAADPQNIGALYAATQIGIFRTAGKGMSWSKADSGLPLDLGIASLAVDPKAPNTVYALISGTVGPPWGQPGGVFKTTDGGMNWSMASSGLEELHILYNSVLDQYNSALLIDPQNPNTIYLTKVWQPGSCCRGSASKSMDGGMNWATAEFGNHVLLAIDPQTPTTLYASGDYGTVSKSTDSGANWSDVPLPPEAITSDDDEFWTPVISVTVDPRNSSVVYAAGSGGLFKSTDGGTSWQTMNSGLSPYICAGPNYSCGEPYWGEPYRVGSLIIDPQSSNTLYAQTTGGILRSVDGAASWSAVNQGLFAPTVHSIGSMVIHPKDSTVYVATDDGVYAITFRP